MNAYPLNVEPMNGSATYNCVGSVLISFQVEGEIYSSIQGAGDAEIVMSAAGEAKSTVKASGDAAMEMSGAGTLQGTTHGSSCAEIKLSAIARPLMAKIGAGFAPITIDGNYKIPASIPILEAYKEAPGSRTIAVLSESRVIEVPIERYAQVRPVLRVERIQSEARTA